MRPSKGKTSRNEWLKGEVERADVEEEAYTLLNDPRDDIHSVEVWSVKDQQFVWSYLKFNGEVPTYGMAEGKTERATETEAADSGTGDSRGTGLVEVTSGSPDVRSEPPKRKRGRPSKNAA